MPVQGRSKSLRIHVWIVPFGRGVWTQEPQIEIIPQGAIIEIITEAINLNLQSSTGKIV